MQLPLKIALVLILLIYILFIVKAVKRKNMRISYLISWLIIGLLLIIALFTPGLIRHISNAIGFEVPLNMIFTAAVFVILFFVFDMNISISKEQNKNIILIQEISILKKKIEYLEKQNQK